MFDRIAPRYDLVNRLITFGLDQRWRRDLIARLQLRSGERVVDLAAGTADLARLAYARGARCIAVDLSFQMLRRARAYEHTPPLVQVDAAALPLPSRSIDVITCGFALRNFVALEAVLDECARVLAPGGRLGLLEVDSPRARPLRALHEVHFRHLVPWLGGWLSDRDAYAYLPESVTYLPEESVLRDLLRARGFDRFEKRAYGFGAAQSIVASIA